MVHLKRQQHIPFTRKRADADAQTRKTWKELVHEMNTDTEAGMLPGITQRHNVRSKFYWFSEFCNSQCLSHFAAPFIVA